MKYEFLCLIFKLIVGKLADLFQVTQLVVIRTEINRKIHQLPSKYMCFSLYHHCVSTLIFLKHIIFSPTLSYSGLILDIHLPSFPRLIYQYSFYELPTSKLVSALVMQQNCLLPSQSPHQAISLSAEGLLLHPQCLAQFLLCDISQ